MAKIKNIHQQKEETKEKCSKMEAMLKDIQLNPCFRLLKVSA